MAAVQNALLNGIPVVRLSHGPYEADICPGMGANCIRFAKNGLSVLRTPPDMSTFRSNPNVYGMPLLFPPNRIANGTYTFQGRVYRLPINEPARGHHIHGFLSGTAFDVAEPSAGETEAAALFSAAFGEASPYHAFPHAFSVTLEYRLNAQGLSQRLSLANLGSTDMPTGLGFHTAFALPFVPGSLEADYRLSAKVGKEICLNPKTILPTGEYLADGAVGSALSNGSLCPAQGAISNHFQGLSGEIALLHLPTGAAVRYTPDPGFSFLMLWNGGGSSGFVCPEPQSWQVDAPNSPLPPDMTGFRFLAPGGEIHFISRLSIDLGTF